MFSPHCQRRTSLEEERVGLVPSELFLYLCALVFLSIHSSTCSCLFSFISCLFNCQSPILHLQSFSLCLPFAPCLDPPADAIELWDLDGNFTIKVVSAGNLNVSKDAMVREPGCLFACLYTTDTYIVQLLACFMYMYPIL